MHKGMHRAPSKGRSKWLIVMVVVGMLVALAIPAVAAPLPKVDVCHYADGTFHLINISENAFQAHVDHGDASPGDFVPGSNETEKFAEGSCDILVWTLFDTVDVPSRNEAGNGPGTVSSSIALTTATTYELKASGTYTYWPAQLPDAGIADAQCSLRPQGSFNAGPGPQWINGDALTGYENYLEVWMNGALVDWQPQPCNPAHVYTVDITGAGVPVQFTIIDSGYGDNSGFITVEIWGWQ